MADDNSINRISLDEIEVIFEEIASLASQCDSLYFHMCHEEDAAGEMYARNRAIRSLIGNIGLLAEVGYRGVSGTPGMVDRIEDWVLPPSYQWKRDSASAA